MAIIQHADIPDGERHEPKGVASASSGQVYVANGAASGVWTTPATVVLYVPSLSPVSVAANTTAEQTLTVTGLLTTDTLLSVVKPTSQAGLGIVGWRIPFSNTLALTFSNNTASPIVPTASQVYKVAVWR